MHFDAKPYNMQLHVAIGDRCCDVHRLAHVPKNTSQAALQFDDVEWVYLGADAWWVHVQFSGVVHMATSASKHIRAMYICT